MYFLGPEPQRFNEAEDYCVSQSSHLASIHSNDSFHTARSLCRSVATRGCWIGLRRIGDYSNEWSYTDGTPPDFGFYNNSNVAIQGQKPPWIPYEPGSSEECVEFFGRSYDFYWNDIYCGVANYPICYGTKHPTITPTITPTILTLHPTNSSFAPTDAPTNNPPTYFYTFDPTKDPAVSPITKIPTLQSTSAQAWLLLGVVLLSTLLGLIVFLIWRRRQKRQKMIKKDICNIQMNEQADNNNAYAKDAFMMKNASGDEDDTLALSIAEEEERIKQQQMDIMKQYECKVREKNDERNNNINKDSDSFDNMFVEEEESITSDFNGPLHFITTKGNVHEDDEDHDQINETTKRDCSKEEEQVGSEGEFVVRSDDEDICTEGQ